MLKEFTKEYIRANKGCYTLEEVNELSFINKDNITLIDILNSEISIKDKRCFLFNKCELSLNDKKYLALKMTWCILPIYEAKYPNDNRVRECLQAIEDYNNGIITIDVLREKSNAAAAAANAATYAATIYVVNAVANAATCVAAAVANAVANAATCVACVDYDTAYAVYAVCVTADISYENKILTILIDFVNNN